MAPGVWVPRLLTPVLLQAANHFAAVFVGGPRQAGKTTLLARTFPGHRYVSLDVPSVAEAVTTRPAEFLSVPTIFDELQHAPALTRHLKAAIDPAPKPGFFLLTGSQALASMAAISESLSGRCAVLSLNTLSLRELVDAELLGAADWTQLLFRGGYPGLWERSELPRELWYSSYLATYLERDVRSLANVGSLRDFERAVRVLALRTGRLLSFTEVSRDVGVAVSTVREWVAVLESSGILMLLEPYHRSEGKRLVKSPKVYWSDAGFAAWLVGIQTPEQLLASPLLGGLWETLVHAELRRLLSTRAEGAKPWFWAAHGSTEVDFVLERGGRFVLLEAKLSSTPGGDALKGARAFARAYGEDAVQQVAVVCTTPSRFGITERAEAVGLADLGTLL